ncbi:LysR family transcriptional regulator [Candidatus Marinamargulisbacteria bacterium SCGC AAA071-K20]|nr:LysR family transcriptional regulator [Candidatus Marinamargulisbacteria bacterium SCGC AAA071-K20]
MNGLNASLLSTFVCVVEQKKVLTASKVLNLTQPAVTTQIRQLESHLGVVLFTRSVKGMVVTSAGETLYSYAKDILLLVDEAVTEVSKGSKLKGTLSIIASSTIGSYVLPSILHQFSLEYPDLKITLELGNTQDVIGSILKGKHFMGFIEGVSNHPPLTFKPFLEDELIMVSSPLFRKKVKTIKDLEKLPIISREYGSGTRAIIEQRLKDLGLSIKKMKSQFEFGGTEAIKSAVMDNLGVSILSKFAVRSELQSGRLVALPFKGLILSRDFQWVMNSKDLTGINKLFFEFTTKFVKTEDRYVSFYSI